MELTVILFTSIRPRRGAGRRGPSATGSERESLSKGRLFLLALRDIADAVLQAIGLRLAVQAGRKNAGDGGWIRGARHRFLEQPHPTGRDMAKY